MIVASFQGPVVFGDAEANLRTVEATLAEAQKRGAEILAMPETFLHGCFAKAEDARRHEVDLGGSFFAGVLERLKRYECTLLLGLSERRGGKSYNTVVVVERGRLVGKYTKAYPVFGYETRGGEFPVFEKRGIKYGVVICADTSYPEPARILAMKGAQIIFTPHFNYIPYEGLARHTWEVRQHHMAIAVDNGVYVVRSNVVVPESEGSGPLGYPGVGVGDAVILDRSGHVLAEAGICKRALLVAELPDEDLRKGGPRPWRYASPEIARALYEQYQEMFGKHANQALGSP